MRDAWKTEGDGPIWVPVLNAMELIRNIPTDLLARMAYQESTFRSGVISGAIPSSAGALGLMQLMPQFYSSVQVPVPFSSEDTNAQISQSAAFLMSLYARFGDWQEAVAGYNWGGGNEHHQSIVDGGKYILADMPIQTQNYVREVFADVPIQGALLP
jgi:soluble lytic murein transglycosylase-like protein